MRARLYIVALQTIFALCVSACGGGDVSAPIGATSAKAITPSVTPDRAASDLARAADVVLQPAPPDRTYIKASNTGTEDLFGFATALSADGNTLVVGVSDEDSSATGINGNQLDNSATDAGAVYVYVRNANGVWFQQAYLKASNTGAGDWFGRSVAISADGLTLAVGATGEDSGPLGPQGNIKFNKPQSDSGAVYIFTLGDDGTWSQHALLKASNAGEGDWFGASVALNSDGTTLAVGAPGEAGSATGINGNQVDNSAKYAGAAYVFVPTSSGWAQQAYVKASNTDADDHFGSRVALSGSGFTLVVAASDEASNATGINGNQLNDSLPGAGAAYIFTRDRIGDWSQQAYVKASNTGALDHFGSSIALSADGATLAVGALFEDSQANGTFTDQSDDSSVNAGAVYIFGRNSSGTWSQGAFVKAQSLGKEFGVSVALNAGGTTLAVGQPYEETGTVGGNAHVFILNFGTWHHHAQFKAGYPGSGDKFGFSVALNANGDTLAVGAFWEDSSATGINGNQLDNSATNSGAVYVFH